MQWGVKQHAFDTLVEDEEKDEMREQKGDAEIQLIEQSYVAGAGDYCNVALISLTFNRVYQTIFFRPVAAAPVRDAWPAGCGQVQHCQQSPGLRQLVRGEPQ